jgi:hypothetical protein
VDRCLTISVLPKYQSRLVTNSRNVGLADRLPVALQGAKAVAIPVGEQLSLLQ